MRDISEKARGDCDDVKKQNKRIKRKEEEWGNAKLDGKQVQEKEIRNVVKGDHKMNSERRKGDRKKLKCQSRGFQIPPFSKKSGRMPHLTRFVCLRSMLTGQKQKFGQHVHITRVPIKCNC
jgi:hypothetical protein